MVPHVFFFLRSNRGLKKGRAFLRKEEEEEEEVDGLSVVERNLFLESHAGDIFSPAGSPRTHTHTDTFRSFFIQESGNDFSDPTLMESSK